MLFGGEAEPALRGEAERLGIARDLPQYEGEVAAAQPLFEREQCILGRLGDNVDQAVAQRGRQPGTIGPPAAFERSGILHPQPGPILPGPRRIERERKRQPRPARLVRRCEDFGVAQVLGKTGPPGAFARQGKRARHH